MEGLAATRGIIRLGQYCHGDAGNTGELTLVVGHFDVPNMSGAADVNWACDSRDPALAYAAEMVCVDFKSDCPIARRGRASCPA